MAKKINLNFLFVTAVSIILTVFFTSVISYRLFQKEVFSELSSFADIMDDLNLLTQMKNQGFLRPDNEIGRAHV